jgi:hypothetical protein
MIPAAYILPSAKIDRDKWNACIHNSSNGLIYACTDYLDAMADQWHGIVIDDYRAVMPLPWRIRFGIRYCYMPPFIQQLGLIGNYNTNDIAAVFRTLPDFISLADIHFNFSNKEITAYKEVSLKTNCIIDLSAGYETIRAHYRKDLKENIKKNIDTLVYAEDMLSMAAGLFQGQYQKHIKHVRTEEYDRFFSLCQLFESKGQSIVRAIMGSGTEVLAVAVLLKDGKRIYNLMNTTTPEGRRCDANDLLVDRIIHEFAGQRLLFDFEGSELPGVKAFYEKFGAENQPYYYYHYNGLPFYLRWLKR